MTRHLYRLLIRLHPPGFRQRFGDEMMSVLDETAGQHSFSLMLDGLVSVARQWLFRTSSWKLLLASFGGFIQVFGFGIPIKGHRLWKENRQALTPQMEEVVLFALALLCSLFVVITFLILWNTHLKRRPSANYKSYTRAVSPAHFPERRK